jgi:DNA-binding transcriptional regulator LsrR (DeoR family)
MFSLIHLPYLIADYIPQSVRDLVRRGVSEGTVTILPQSSLQDTAKIENILNDTLKVVYCDSE